MRPCARARRLATGHCGRQRVFIGGGFNGTPGAGLGKGFASKGDAAALDTCSSSRRPQPDTGKFSDQASATKVAGTKIRGCPQALSRAAQRFFAHCRDLCTVPGRRREIGGRSLSRCSTASTPFTARESQPVEVGESRGHRQDGPHSSGGQSTRPAGRDLGAGSLETVAGLRAS